MAHFRFALSLALLGAACSATPGCGPAAATSVPAGAAPAAQAGANEPITGTIAPAASGAVAWRPREYAGEFLVLEARPQGASVARGDLLVRLDTERIDEQVRQAEVDLRSAEIAHAGLLERHALADETAADELVDAAYALELFGVPPPRADSLVSSLDDLRVRHGGFRRAGERRPMPHESWYASSGHFYLYGHAYAAYVQQQQSPAVQQRLWPEMLVAVLYCRQPDGPYWDYPLYSYHRPYGTGFASQVPDRMPRDTRLPHR